MKPRENREGNIMDLKATQKEIYQNKIDKGFNTTDVNKEFCLLYGEVSEAYEAWRKQESSIGEELADVLWVVICLANQTGVDLTAALEASLEKKRTRDAHRFRP